MYSYGVRDLKTTPLSDAFGQCLIFLCCDCGYPSPQPAYARGRGRMGRGPFRHWGGACGVRSAM